MSRTARTPALVLDRTPPRAGGRPQLDAAQRSVVAHRDGPLLVLAGPGTGKTTTIVEALVERLSGRDPLAPSQVLALTFGRRAAAELRDRVAARVGGGELPLVSTFHAFAYALLRQWSDPEAFLRPLRLLSGPEQEQRVREVLDGSVADGRLPWPADLAAALGTAGLSAEVRAVLARARTLGLDPDQIADLGRAAGVEGWTAVGRFAAEYLDVLDLEGVTDYAELVHRAVILSARDDVRAHLHRTYRAVYVDEYQDTDPAQVRLLANLVGPAASLVVVGDPDQSIYAFRGADVRGILRFRDEFRRVDGSPAGTVVLDRTRRFGPVLRAAASGVLGDRGLPGIPRAELQRHRHPTSQAATPGQVEVLTVDDEGALADHVADLLRRARLASRTSDQPLDWSDMAVVVRSGTRQIPALSRALLAAGVPIEVAGDELPLHREPAVAPLLLALRVAADPGALTEDVAETLLSSPLVDADPADLRRLVRLLRAAERDAGVPPGQLRSTARLLRDALADPRTVADAAATGRAGSAAAAVESLGRLLAAAAERIAHGASPEEALWLLWAGADGVALRRGWPARLQRTALRGGSAGRRADRDLDAVCALFDTAQRASDRAGGVKGVRSFLAEVQAQAIPAETLAERAVRGDAVRLLTAHRAKGLEWRLVVVAGAQEGSWPDVRPRGSLLMPDRLTPDGLAPPPRAADLLAEERRLFYVACTRARDRLVVVSVDAADEDGDRPSRFVADLGVTPVPLRGRPARPLSPAGLVADLRAAAVDPAASPALRSAAVQRLARLAAACDTDGEPLVPAADPMTWWGTRERTPGAQPVRPADEPVRLSGSALAGLLDCPLRWFLAREARGEGARSTAIGFGSLVHVLADRVGRAQLPADLDTLDAALDRIWARLEHESAWVSRRERREARAALGRFLAYHRARQRTLLATEQEFDVVLDVRPTPATPEPPIPVRVRGALDRVEVDAAGRLHPIDLKTTRVPRSGPAVARDPQLGVYQAAVAAGAVTDGPAEPGGAALVQLRLDAARSAGAPKVQTQPALEPVDDEPGSPTWVEVALHGAATVVRTERFDARPGPTCAFCEFQAVCPAQEHGAVVVP